MLNIARVKDGGVVERGGWDVRKNETEKELSRCRCLEGGSVQI
jgi:hypothetical protein